MANLKITLIRGFAGKTAVQKANAQSLGLRKIGQTVIREDTPVYRGMIDKIRHMVTVEEAD
ncbi:50S ribosomal protein L30 [Bifidobacterium primatium]|uniref:Large ribosomal subunit protein uL30 n=2 Tax=Bifidobacterium TaxID=1678 RepID=A0A2M9H9F9_9BIFI|nr:MULTISPECIES: 50S ribosomal protein L30 [Bifidobacterium]NEG96445.1 50S ribosomal protein L30 [Bifidobacterium sp. SMB2]NEH10923.1 50S ribosomal protein L30 [Bifidobacterium saimiriisciurei]PJM73441.1 50S ribosomal protein L30 [Bifidobacterium primatium]